MKWRKQARGASRKLAVLGTKEKNQILEAMAVALDARKKEIFDANALMWLREEKMA